MNPFRNISPGRYLVRHALDPLQAAGAAGAGADGKLGLLAGKDIDKKRVAVSGMP